MNTKQRTIAIYFGVISLLISSCRSGQLFRPTLTPIPISTNTPAPTNIRSPTLTPTPTDIPKKFNPANGHWYSVVYISMNWYGAKDYCRNMKAYLVTITSEQENQFVYRLNPNSWIGLSDAVEEGNWKWVTDESVKYTNWAQTEPNNCTDCTNTYIKEGEDFAHFNDSSTDKWNDWPNLESSFVCEWETSK